MSSTTELRVSSSIEDGDVIHLTRGYSAGAWGERVQSGVSYGRTRELGFVVSLL